MKRLIVVAAVTAAVVTAAPAAAAPKVAPAGSTIQYVFESDSQRNNISYYGPNGRVSNVDRAYFPLEKDGTFRSRHSFRASRPQKAAVFIQSLGGWARCSVFVNGKRVEYARKTGTVPAADCGFPLGVDPDY